MHIYYTIYSKLNCPKHFHIPLVDFVLRPVRVYNRQIK